MSLKIEREKNKLPDPITLETLNISLPEIRRIMADFRSEMIKGLSGQDSSLKMIPAYVDSATGKEKGKFIALDLGGTNFRILRLELKGKGKINKLCEKRFVLENKHTQGTQKELFDFIAVCIKKFIKKEAPGAREKHNIGFTFSFPVRQTGISSGIFVKWTKEFSVKGSRGRDVVILLNEALARQKINNVNIAALANDTVGTLVSRSYKDPNCDIGMILGTGTNACYRERASNIFKQKGLETPTGKMIINIEWGNFNKLTPTVYDRSLDKESVNPGEQMLEKMVSGMYLSKIAAIMMADFIKRKILFREMGLSGVGVKWLNSGHMSKIESDRTVHLKHINALLKEKEPGLESSFEDRLLIKKICNLVSMRASYISAAVLAAVITKIDPDLSREHTVAVDGTVYEKYPGFAGNIKYILKQIFSKESHKIKMILTKDGSGIGAAVIAAIAAGNTR